MSLQEGGSFFFRDFVNGSPASIKTDDLIFVSADGKTEIKVVPIDKRTAIQWSRVVNGNVVTRYECFPRRSNALRRLADIFEDDVKFEKFGRDFNA